MIPGGQLHFALWFVTLHWAVELHGSSYEQGLTQALFLHAWLEAHSSSDEQPISIGETKIRIQ